MPLNKETKPNQTDVLLSYRLTYLGYFSQVECLSCNSGGKDEKQRNPKRRI